MTRAGWTGAREAGPVRDERRRDAHARSRRMAVWVLVAVVLLLTAAPGLRARARGATSAAVGAIAGWVTPRDAALERERAARLAAEAKAARLGDAKQLVDAAAKLSTSFAASGRTIVTARVIAFTPAASASSAHRVELDVGRDGGIETDEAVVAPGGLVGRVTAVNATTSTVTLLDDPGSVVGVRVERSGALARVTGTAPAGITARDAGDVTLVVAQGGDMKRGDRVVTAGSPSGRPYPVGLPIGTITHVDSDTGRIERTATLHPSVDLSSLDVVGVLTWGTAK